MLHLWPLKTILSVVIAASVALSILLTIYFSDGTDPFSFIWSIVRWAGITATFCVAVLFMLWRWSSHVQHQIFPYLGGTWTGNITFGSEDEPEAIDAVLHVHHTPFSITLILESKESLSRTLAVQASKSVGVRDDDKLYYVYLNTRKEGISKPNYAYRGVAILRIQTTSKTMVGDYFTESHRRGRISFDTPQLNPWWVLWK